MKYGATFKIDLYDYEREQGETITTRASDFLQMQLWAPGKTDKLPDGAKDLYNNYAVVFFALKREGRLAEFGIKDEKLDLDALNDIAGKLSVFVSMYKDDELPLKAQTK